MDTRQSFDGVNPTILSQLNAAKETAAALAEERRLAEESAHGRIAESEAALLEVSAAFELTPRPETATSSDSYYGPTSPEEAMSLQTESEEEYCITSAEEGLFAGHVLELDDEGLAVVERSKSYVPKSEIVERRKRGMRVWRAQDGMELIRSIVHAVLGCFHSMMGMLGIHRNNTVDERAPLVNRGYV